MLNTYFEFYFDVLFCILKLLLARFSTSFLSFLVLENVQKRDFFFLVEKWIHNIHIPNATWLKCAFRWLKLMVYEKNFFNGIYVQYSVFQWIFYPKVTWQRAISCLVLHQCDSSESFWFQIKQRGWKSIDNELVKESLYSKSISIYCKLFFNIKMAR